jgi:RHH-type proline utilization regulon transcriptional repressor/proline dehydrogenase/delta 1-pyrroline-5-carboxylate dehydrogenase
VTRFEIFARAAAARAVGCRATISVPMSLGRPAAEAVGLLDQLTDSWAGAIEFVDEDDKRLAELIQSGRVARIRYAAPDRVPPVIRTAAAEALQYVADAPVLAHGRVELLWYLREQSIAHVYHRYGNLGPRTGEQRDEPV